MDQNSQTSELSPSKCILEGQIRECYARVVYSHKTHEKCADLLLSRLSLIKVTQIVLSAMATGGFIATMLGVGQLATAVGMLVSTSLLALNTYTKDSDLGELAQKHKQAADELWLIREEYLSLLADITMKDSSLQALRNQRDKLVEALHQVYRGSPCTTPKAYAEARKALKISEEMTFSDTEIDLFLPLQLRKNTEGRDS